MASEWYEEARQSVARRLGGRPDDTVVFTRNTTDASNLLAASLSVTGAEGVLTLDIEHHANLLPWRRAGIAHRTVRHASTIVETLARLDGALAAQPASLLAITGASNVTGEVVPLAEVTAIARRHGARTFVDAAQLAPHRAIAIAADGIDYLALSGHKTYAPYGAGVLVGRGDWLDRTPPYLAGGGAVLDVTVDDVVWARGARRHEAGTPNLAGAVALATALETIAPSQQEAREDVLRAAALSGLASIDGVSIPRIWKDAGPATATVSFTVDGYEPALVSAYLSAEHGIGVRAGRFCAHPLMARLGLPGGALRASFGIGSRMDDADRLVEAIRMLLAKGPAETYVKSDDGWTLGEDRRDLVTWAAC